MAGSTWFSTGEGMAMAEMIRAGTLDLSIFEQVSFPLDRINEALAIPRSGSGGFANYSVTVA